MRPYGPVGPRARIGKHTCSMCIHLLVDVNGKGCSKLLLASLPYSVIQLCPILTKHSPSPVQAVSKPAPCLSKLGTIHSWAYKCLLLSGVCESPPHPGSQVFVTFGGMRVSQIPVQSCPILSKRSPSPVQAVTKPPPFPAKCLASAWQALGKRWASSGQAPPFSWQAPPFPLIGI